MRISLFVFVSLMSIGQNQANIRALTQVVHTQVGSFLKNAALKTTIAPKIPFDEENYIQSMKNHFSEFAQKHDIHGLRDQSFSKFASRDGFARLSKDLTVCQSWNAHDLYALEMHELGHIVEKWRSHYNECTELWSQLFEFYAFRKLYFAGKAGVGTLVYNRLKNSFVFSDFNLGKREHESFIEKIIPLTDEVNSYSYSLIQSLNILARANGNFDQALSILRSEHPWTEKECLDKAQHISEYLNVIFPETQHCSGKNWSERLINLSNSSDPKAHEILQFNYENSTELKPSFLRGVWHNFKQAFSKTNLTIQFGALAWSLLCHLTKKNPIAGVMGNTWTHFAFILGNGDDFYHDIFTSFPKGIMKVCLMAGLATFLDKAAADEEESNKPQKDSLKSKILKFYKKHKACICSGVSTLLIGQITEKRPLTLAVMTLSSIISTKISESVTTFKQK